MSGFALRRRLATIDLLDVAAWSGVLLTAAIVAAVDDAGDTIDTAYFLRAAHTLFSSRWLETFGDPHLQAGPLQVGGIGGAARLGEAVGVSALRGVCVLQSVLLTALVMAGAAALVGVRQRRRLIVATAGLAVLATGTISSAYFYGHPAEVVNPVLWILAARASRAGRPWVAGLLIGVSAGFETWGILGLALLLLDRRPRALVRGVGAGLAVVAAMYGPFVIHGPFAMFAYHWAVTSGTLPAALGIGPSFGWPLRVLQAALSGVVGAVACLVLRRYGSVCWIAPLAILWTKVGSDPGRGAWYLLAPETAALLGAAYVAGSGWLDRGRRRSQSAERQRSVSIADGPLPGRG